VSGAAPEEISFVKLATGAPEVTVIVVVWVLVPLPAVLVAVRDTV